MDDTRNPTQDGQTDVDEEVSATATLEEDTQRRQDDGEDDLADVTVGYQVSFSCPIHLSVRGEREREQVSKFATYEAVNGIVAVL